MDVHAYSCTHCASIWLRDQPIDEKQLDIVPCPVCRTVGSVQARGKFHLGSQPEIGPMEEGSQDVPDR